MVLHVFRQHRHQDVDAVGYGSAGVPLWFYMLSVHIAIKMLMLRGIVRRIVRRASLYRFTCFPSTFIGQGPKVYRSMPFSKRIRPYEGSLISVHLPCEARLEY